MPAARIVSLLTWIALLGAAVWALVCLGMCAWERLTYPFELEWMEGSMVDHSARVVDGKPIYTAPTWEHVPYLYTPLYFQVCAALSTVTGLDFAVMRIVNLGGTLGALAILAMLLRRDLGTWQAGLVAAAVPVAGYGYVDSWYDLARNDGLFFLLVMGSVAIARWGGKTLPLAGLLAALAFLAKQSEVFVLPGLCLAALALGVRRAIWLGVWSGLGLAVTVGIAHLATDGWFTFYVFTMPAEHGVNGALSLFWNDWKEGILPLWPAGVLLAMVLAAHLCRRPTGKAWLILGALGLAVVWLPALFPGPKMPAMLTSVGWPAAFLLLAWSQTGPTRTTVLDDRARAAGFWLVIAAGLFAVAWISRRHAGGHLNAFLPALIAAGILAAYALEFCAERWQKPWVLPAAGVFTALLFWNLHYSPSTFVPSKENRAANEALREWIRGVDGDVFLLSHGHLAAREGKVRTAHAMAIADLFQYQDGKSEEMQTFIRSVVEAGQSGRFAAIALDKKFLQIARGLVGPAAAGMRPVPPPVLPPKQLQPVVGMRGAFPTMFLKR